MRTRGPAHQETRERILEVARALVVEGGHEQLSLREIAREAGFSPASLYEYFDGKDAIVATLAARAAASLRAALDRAAKETRGPRAALVQVGLAYVAWAKRHRADFLLLFQRLPSQRKSLEPPAPSDSPYRVVVDAIVRAHEAGVVKARGQEAVERLAYGLWAAVHGMAMLQLTHLASFDADFAAADRATLEALIDGFGH